MPAIDVSEMSGENASETWPLQAEKLTTNHILSFQTASDSPVFVGNALHLKGFEDIVSFLRQENAKDICAIQLPPEMKYSNYFVIVSGSSPRHLHAMAHYLMKMYKHLKTDCEPHVVIEGKDTDDWLCIDFGHTVVHFMLPETREVYELEKLWTLRSYDDQLAQMIPESMPENFILGMNPEEEELASI
uniref:Mitochondrial assembly of ribosomal large subunit protein 1 n=1 Tax=Anolis carolinensis TaxID=28377 RepID=A0A803T8F4_ANOCA